MKTKKSISILSYVAATMFIAYTAVSCGNNTKDTDNAKNEEFVKEAVSSNLLEINAGELASANGSTDIVREFGRLMVSDHRAVGDELATLAGSKNIIYTNEMMSKHQEDLEDLSGLAGYDFDKEFAELMVNSHQDAVDLYSDFADENVAADKERKNVDADLRKFATDKLPTLRAHLDAAKRLKDSINNIPDSLRIKVDNDRDSLGRVVAPPRLTNNQ